MRDIVKYRGRRKDTGEWVKGYYWKEPIVFPNNSIAWSHYIYAIDESVYPPNAHNYLVIPETVGEYTGLKDKKKDKDLFAGDRVVIGRDVGVLVWDEYELCLALQLDSDDSFQAICRFYSYEEIDAVEYIGNEEKP